MQPPSEMVHWLFGMGILLLGLLMLAEVIVGREIWVRRAWRAYLWPGLAFALGVLMWPVMTFFTNSAIHMVAHGAWAQALMVMGGAELGLAKGKLRSRWWKLATPIGIAVSGAAFLVHEQNDWFFARSAFLHHLVGWTLIGAALFPLALVFRPRSVVLKTAFALSVIALSVMLFSDRDLAPVFGHLSPLAGPPHR
jgi:hypothetical protein